MLEASFVEALLSEDVAVADRSNFRRAAKMAADYPLGGAMLQRALTLSGANSTATPGGAASLGQVAAKLKAGRCLDIVVLGGSVTTGDSTENSPRGPCFGFPGKSTWSQCAQQAWPALLERGLNTVFGGCIRPDGDARRGGHRVDNEAKPATGTSRHFMLLSTDAAVRERVRASDLVLVEAAINDVGNEGTHGMRGAPFWTELLVRRLLRYGGPAPLWVESSWYHEGLKLKAPARCKRTHGCDADLAHRKVLARYGVAQVSVWEGFFGDGKPGGGGGGGGGDGGGGGGGGEEPAWLQRPQNQPSGLPPTKPILVKQRFLRPAHLGVSPLGGGWPASREVVPLGTEAAEALRSTLYPLYFNDKWHPTVWGQVVTAEVVVGALKETMEHTPLLVGSRDSGGAVGPPPAIVPLPPLVEATSAQEELYSKTVRKYIELSAKNVGERGGEESSYGPTANEVRSAGRSGRGSSLKQLKGWSYRTDKVGKPHGWISTEIGSCLLIKPGVARPQVLSVTLLKSYAHMGSFTVEALGGGDADEDTTLASKRIDTSWRRTASMATEFVWDLRRVSGASGGSGGMPASVRGGTGVLSFRFCVVASDPPRIENKVKLFNLSVM